MGQLNVWIDLKTVDDWLDYLVSMNLYPPSLIEPHHCGENRNGGDTGRCTILSGKYRDPGSDCWWHTSSPTPKSSLLGSWLLGPITRRIRRSGETADQRLELRWVSWDGVPTVGLTNNWVNGDPKFLVVENS